MSSKAAVAKKKADIEHAQLAKKKIKTAEVGERGATVLKTTT